MEYIKKEDEIPSLIEMNFEKLGEMTLDQFKKMEKKITSNELDEIEDAVWSNLITRCTQRKGKQHCSTVFFSWHKFTISGNHKNE